MKRHYFAAIAGATLILTCLLTLSPASVQAAGRYIVKGVVASEYGGVEGAKVRLPGHQEYTLTDKNGEYQLLLPEDYVPSLIEPLMVTAGKEGWFNNSTQTWPGNENANIALYPIPSSDDPAYRFIPPTVCSQCHNKLAKYWDKSKMAHTTSNVKVLNMYNGTDVTGRKQAGPGFKNDNPDQEGNCIVCHAPSAAVAQNGPKNIEAALWSRATEWDGISCDFCHKIKFVVKSNDTPSLYKAVLKRQAPIQGNSILVLGPYDDVVNTVMSASYSPVYDQGVYCALCHSQVQELGEKKGWDRKAVYTDKEWQTFDLGNDAIIPVQTTYQEWRDWQQALPDGDKNKNKKCQDCHMSWSKEMLPYDEYIVDGQARKDFGVKRDPESIHPHRFDGTSEKQLQSALSMEMDGEVKDGILEISVFINNSNGGHWVPTGDPMRQVLLLVSATDSNGNQLEQVDGDQLPEWAGAGKKADGNYAGLPGTIFSKVLQDAAGEINVPFWKATSVLQDTRIRPKTTVTKKFKFKLKDPQDEPQALANLIYRPFPRDLVNTKKWDSKDTKIASSAW